MKILHLSGAMQWGGNEQQLGDLIFSLNEFHIENVIFCFENSPIENYAQKNNILYTSIQKTKSFSIYLARELATYIKEHNVDIIHIHTSNFVTTYVLADMLHKLRTPTVFSKKGISDKSSLLSPIKYNYKGIHRVICISNAVSNAFKKVLKKKNHSKVRVIYDGIIINKPMTSNQINLRSQLNIAKGVFLIGNIANHSQAKDLATFVRTVYYLIKELKRTDIHFVQIGMPSKYTKEYMALVDEYQLHNVITFMGFMDNAHEYMPQFDLYLITSKAEGMSLLLYESFLKKVPVVSTAAGGIPEAITHGKNGFIAPIGDFKNLALYTNILLNDRELRQMFISSSYEKLIAEYNAIDAAKDTYDIYCSLIHENHHRTAHFHL